MSDLAYVKPEQILLHSHPKLNELWVQARIIEDPSLLGLGELIVKDKERRQPRAGRLDLLLQEPESHKRYEVEVQLGRTDESHIIRTIEYWDIERKRYPQYDHTAVIVAEDITSRFLNVISLFNGFIPLVAIQMGAILVGQQIALIFTTVLDEMPLGLEEEDEELQEVTDRAYWEDKANKSTVAMADELLDIIHTFDAEFDLNYTKFYIGLAKNKQSSNFAIFRPQKHAIKVELRHDRAEEVEQKLEETGLEFDYDARTGKYRVQLPEGKVEPYAEPFGDLLRMAHDYYNA